MIAIVGAALRLPGATSMEAFWDRLLAAGDTITRAPDAVPDYEQQPLGVADNARFVPAYGRIDGVTEFDHERFQMAPAEAMLTDPQQRVLLEVVDEALYTAAVSAGGRAATSLFAGTGLNTYEATIRRHLAGAPGTDELAVELGTARDYAAGRIAYRLGLGGAAVNVLAACSTGLVAVHLGCRTLLQDEADVAVAAVSAIRFPEWHGYWAAPGGISSPDGVCRPFDARAAGTVPADGVAAVVLKRMPDALAAGDDVLAVILGSALNNDGRKGGFGDVSAAAQEAVIGAALNSAGVDPAAVAYVESHGTATRLGDVVEWAALQRVFGHNDRPVHVGAVKGNLGHTREAAGMAGLLKAVAVMRHGVVPPSANFDSLAGELSSDRSPLRPVAEATPLDGPDAEPLAGVSAFGLGGTNAHVVLRPAPARPEPAGGEEGVILLSSPRLASLDAETDAVHRLVDGTPDVAAGVAARSQVRAQPHAYRRYVALEPTRDRAAAFSKRALDQASRRTSRRPADVAFVFPGVGAEYAGMGAGLAGAAAAFRRSLAETVQLSAAAGVDIEPLLARPERAGAGVTDFDRMLRRSGHGAAADSPPAAVPVRHLALFAVQLALVDLLEDLGIRPAAVAGHSLGEWTAATVAGVLRRSDAVALLARRARLIEQAPCGATPRGGRRGGRRRAAAGARRGDRGRQQPAELLGVRFRRSDRRARAQARRRRPRLPAPRHPGRLPQRAARGGRRGARDGAARRGAVPARDPDGVRDDGLLARAARGRRRLLAGAARAPGAVPAGARGRVRPPPRDRRGRTRHDPAVDAADRLGGGDPHAAARLRRARRPDRPAPSTGRPLAARSRATLARGRRSGPHPGAPVATGARAHRVRPAASRRGGARARPHAARARTGGRRGGAHAG